ncbi:hypothetical protein WH47_03611 [Habropoda laboriosa]|uniref:Uncharacterized protein n=1 Tax=Habropoda laboriosa TaxID=597456 RepID=A0A0L7RIA4_9HYME|nr:hypothetical protein WH47_03611 [Habropoda laboriosa]
MEDSTVPRFHPDILKMIQEIKGYSLYTSLTNETKRSPVSQERPTCQRWILIKREEEEEEEERLYREAEHQRRYQPRVSRARREDNKTKGEVCSRECLLHGGRVPFAPQHRGRNDTNEMIKRDKQPSSRERREEDSPEQQQATPTVIHAVTEKERIEEKGEETKRSAWDTEASDREQKLFTRCFVHLPKAGQVSRSKEYWNCYAQSASISRSSGVVALLRIVKLWNIDAWGIVVYRNWKALELQRGEIGKPWNCSAAKLKSLGIATHRNREALELQRGENFKALELQRSGIEISRNCKKRGNCQVPELKSSGISTQENRRASNSQSSGIAPPQDPEALELRRFGKPRSYHRSIVQGPLDRQRSDA